MLPLDDALLRAELRRVAEDCVRLLVRVRAAMVVSPQSVDSPRRSKRRSRSVAHTRLLFAARSDILDIERNAIVMSEKIPQEKNVLGGPLQACSFAPLTGFFRDGCCATRGEAGVAHLVCVKVTAEFLQFSRERGNDLTTPRPEMRFRGLKPGDRWCLHALRWVEAWKAGMAPQVVLEATNEKVLEIVTLAALKQHALDLH